MKLLFDQNLSFKLCGLLGHLFPGSSHVRLLGLAEADDLAVWRRAGEEGFTLVSLDRDFLAISAQSGPPPQLVHLTCGNRSTAQIVAILMEGAGRILALGAEPAAPLVSLP